MNTYWRENSNTESQQEELKRRFNYDAWRYRPDPAEQERRLSEISLRAIELPEWTPERIQRMTARNFPPYVRSTWRRRDAGTEILVRVELYECGSTQAAREFLLRVLAEFQSNQIERREGILGDVAFVYPGETMILFSRSNVVVWLRNAGPRGIARYFPRSTIRRVSRFASKAVRRRCGLLFVWRN